MMQVLCFLCKQDAHDEDGRWYSILYEGINGNGQQFHRAADVCRLCKIVNIAEEETRMEDVLKRLKALREKNLSYPYAVAAWNQVQVRDGDELERTYVVLLDGKIVTRLDTFPGRKRTVDNLITRGWEVYEPKQRIKSTEQALELVGSTLEARGYRRMI